VKRLLLLSLLFIGCTKVPAGFVGVKVHTMGQKGVDNEVVGVGYYFLPPGIEIYTFPTFMQNYVWTSSLHEGAGHDESFTFQTKEGLSVSSDIGISYEIDPTKVSHLFQTYRQGIQEITHTFLRNAVRDALNNTSSQLSVEEIYGLKKNQFLADSQAIVAAELKDVGIKIDHLYIVGSMRLPDSVLTALNAKIAANQTAMQIQNEVAQARAQAEKMIAEARGESEANRLKMQSINEQFLRYEAIKKWDGKLPTVSGNATPFVHLGEAK
jgi:regulator of protease activity HflC (stomatin/prohibitin superfamily)